jgi:wobble nucleotide-excising tRNase
MSAIKQLFVLTHNVYFHTEVSSKKDTNVEKLNDKAYWILRKEHDCSTIRQYDLNPIHSSYELLWREVKENPESLTLDITLRRIIETHFKTPGWIDVDEILNKMDEPDKMVAHSLFAWSNSGPQALTDDRYTTHERERYLKVFKTIFDQTNQMDHFHLMMGLA